MFFIPVLTSRVTSCRCAALLLKLGGGPKTTEEVEKFREIMAKRYLSAAARGGSVDWSKPLAYMERVNDRLINKARGLLTFNGLTLTSLGVLKGLYAGVAHEQLLVAISVGLAVVSAIILLLSHFLVNFHSLPAYTSDKSDYEAYTLIVVQRIKWISIAATLSIASLAIIPVAKLLAL